MSFPFISSEIRTLCDVGVAILITQLISSTVYITLKNIMNAMKNKFITFSKGDLKKIPYFRYYKPPLYLFFSPFGAASIQGFVHFPIFSTVKLHFGAASIQGGLLFK